MERRQTADFLARLLFVLNIAAWVILVVIFAVFHRAQPEFETLFDRFYQLKLRTDWDMRYLAYLVNIVSAGIIISLAGLLLGKYRGRRRTDHRLALILTGFVSLCMLFLTMALF